MTEKDYALYGTKVLNLKTLRFRIADLYLEKQIRRCRDRCLGLFGVSESSQLPDTLRAGFAFAHTAPYRKSALRLALKKKKKDTI